MIKLLEGTPASPTRRSISNKTRRESPGRWVRKNGYINKKSNCRAIDMGKLFSDDTLTIEVDIKGTELYTCTLCFSTFMENLRNIIHSKNADTVTFNDIQRALLISIDDTDTLKVNCTCPDFCLHPDTQIKLLNGEIYTIEELYNKYNSGEELWVYSTDENGDFKPGKVNNIWISGKENKFIKVTLDNDESIITTGNHPYMMRDGSYVNAEDLKIGDSLMPMYFSYHNGYECVKLNSESNKKSFYSVYKLVSNELLNNEIEEAKVRSGEDSVAIHHKDFNKLNNYPSNLYPMGIKEHWMYHANHVKESGSLDKWLNAGKEYWKTQEAKDKQSEVMRETIQNYYKNRTPEQIERDSEIRRKTTKDAWEKGCFNTNTFKEASKKRGEFLHTPEIEKLATEGIKNYWKNASDDEKKKRNLIKVGNILQKVLDNKEQLTPENYDKYRTNGYPNWFKYFDTWEQVIEHYQLNHKVKDIEVISFDTNIPIYDLEVDTWHNFLVKAGVMLHNCYRYAYWSTQSGFKYGEPQNDNGKEIRNPNNDIGATCKHLASLLYNKSWLTKVSSWLNDYIKHHPKLFAQALDISEDALTKNKSAYLLGKARNAKDDETKQKYVNKWRQGLETKQDEEEIEEEPEEEIEVEETTEEDEEN